MKTVYAITTLGRCEDQRTLTNLPESIRERLMLVVQDHEYEKHHKMWASHVRAVVSLPPEIRTLGPTRRWLYETARDVGFGAVVMMDDDLDFYVRVDPSDWRLTSPHPDTIADMFAEVEQKLAEGYAHIGISGREGNNRQKDYGCECTRYMRVLAYRTDHPRTVVHGRIDGMSDFDVNLQLLKHGLPSYVFFRYAQGQPGTQTAGGISSDRSMEKHEREVDFMVREHAPYVKKVMKKNKGGGDFGTRPEVVVQWKMAHMGAKR